MWLVAEAPSSDILSNEDDDDTTLTKGGDEVSYLVSEGDETIDLGGYGDYRSGASSGGVMLFIMLIIFISMVYRPIRRRRE